MAKKVVLAASEGEHFFDLLNDVPGIEIVKTTPQGALDEIGDAEIFFGFPTPELIAAGTQLRWIQSPSAGVDYLMRVPALRENDIILTNTRGAHAPSIGEHVFALLLALTREIPQAVDWQRQRHWGRDEGYRRLKEIRGATLGIIGFGAIGQAVARRARGFEMQVLAVDAEPVDAWPYVEQVWPLSRTPELLRRADVVVVAAPYTERSKHQFGAEQFGQMRDGSYFVYISRGGIVDEDALVDALRSGKLAGAAIDVAATEPLPPDSPLWDAPNLLITPHLAGASPGKERRVVEIFRENLLRYLSGEPLRNVVDKRKGY